MVVENFPELVLGAFIIRIVPACSIRALECPGVAGTQRDKRQDRVFLFFEEASTVPCLLPPQSAAYLDPRVVIPVLPGANARHARQEDRIPGCLLEGIRSRKRLNSNPSALRLSIYILSLAESVHLTFDQCDR